jgi:hypothetical protein
MRPREPSARGGGKTQGGRGVGGGADAVCYDEAATALGVVLRAHLKADAAPTPT